MIAFAPDESMSSKPAWHAGFLRLLPEISSQLRFAFRRLGPAERSEAVAEAIASIAIAYARLHRQGKAHVAFASTLANFAVRQYLAGRRVGAALNADDVMSPYAQQQRGITLQSLDQRNPAGEWKETLVEDRKATPAELATSRIDLGDWFARLPRIKGRVAQVLATGKTTRETARRFNLTPGRVSQMRRELESDWYQFQGEALACA